MHSSDPKATPENRLPEWLRQQQENSWQIELLIASGIIFFLIRLPGYLRDQYLNYFFASDFNVESLILLIGGYIFGRALLVGFLLYLVLRAIWVAYLGVQFVFPQDINFRRLGYSDYFKEKTALRPDLVQRIIRMERICTFTYSIAIIFTLLSVAIFALWSLLTVIVKNISPQLYDSLDFSLFSLLLLLALCYGGFDRLFFQVFRRSRLISRIYYPVHRLLNTLTLGFLYRREWLTLLSNSRRWLINGSFFLFFFLGLFLSLTEIREYLDLSFIQPLRITEQRRYIDLPTALRVSPNFYEDQLTDDAIVGRGCIQSDILHQEPVRLFVAYWKRIDDHLSAVLKEHRVTNSRPLLRGEGAMRENDEKLAAALRDFIQVSIDGTAKRHLEWTFYRHPHRDVAGFLTYIPTDSLASGRHHLQVRLLDLAGSEDSGIYINDIPFWLEK